MTEKNTQETTEVTEAPVASAPVEAPKEAEAPAATEAKPAEKPAFKKRAPFKKSGERRPRRTFDRPKPEFDQKIVKIRRVVRVMAGGRRFSFSVTMLIGDKKGRVGVGVGKSPDTALAIQKAVKDAKKNMIKIGLTENMSIPHQVSAKYSSSQIEVFPNKGKGLVAGSAVREMFALAGVKDVTAKITTRSKNQINIARAVVEAMMQLPGSEKVTVSLAEEKKPERRRTFTRRTDNK